MHKKLFLPQKICPICNTRFYWRKKWTKRVGMKSNTVLKNVSKMQNKANNNNKAYD